MYLLTDATFMQNLNVSNKVLRVCISRIIISYILFFF